MDGRHDRLPPPAHRHQRRLILVFTGGAPRLHALRGLPFLEALYMTAITVTTVGFGEVNPLAHRSRLHLVLILFGVGRWSTSCPNHRSPGGGQARQVWGAQLDRDIGPAEPLHHLRPCRIGAWWWASSASRASPGGHRPFPAVTQPWRRAHPLHPGRGHRGRNLLAAGIERAKGLVASPLRRGQRLHRPHRKGLRPDLSSSPGPRAGSERKLVRAGPTSRLPFFIGARASPRPSSAQRGRLRGPHLPRLRAGPADGRVKVGPAAETAAGRSRTAASASSWTSSSWPSARPTAACS